MTASPRLYHELAPWFHLLTAPADYAEEAAFYRQALRDACATPPRTLLELGSGGGNNASHLKAEFAMTLVDRSRPMLELSRALNPGCEHLEGDMRGVRLGRTFDCVLVHDAVMYVTTEGDLRRVCDTAFAHCRPGGAALLAPDFVRETFRPGTDAGGSDGADGRSLRYLEWTLAPEPPEATRCRVLFAFLLREADGSVRVEQDEHRFGLLPRATWLRVLAAAGFDARVLRDGNGRDVFVGVRRPGD